MGERMIVSGGGELREYASLDGPPARRIALEGSGALCAGDGCLYVACDGHDMIWRMDSSLLVPTGLFAGGPGVCQMLLSKDHTRLYVLCSEADSLLMLSADSGTPMIVNRVGVNPCAMAMDESGEMIAVAAGACGEILMLSASTLNLVSRLQTPGVAFGTAISSGAVYALSLNEAMNSTLTTFLPGGRRSDVALDGMPGAMAVLQEGVAAATHQEICLVVHGGARILSRLHAPGRAGRLIPSEYGLLMTDTWSDSLYARKPGSGSWKRAVQGVRDVQIL